MSRLFFRQAVRAIPPRRAVRVLGFLSVVALLATSLVGGDGAAVYPRQVSSSPPFSGTYSSFGSWNGTIGCARTILGSSVGFNNVTGQFTLLGADSAHLCRTQKGSQ